MNKKQIPGFDAALQTIVNALEQLDNLPEDDACTIGEKILEAIPDRLHGNKGAEAIHFAYELSENSFSKKSEGFQTLLYRASPETIMRLLNHVYQLKRAAAMLQNPAEHDKHEMQHCSRSLSMEREQLVGELNEEFFDRVQWYHKDYEELVKRKCDDS
jgi:hypothetical protein